MLFRESVPQIKKRIMNIWKALVIYLHCMKFLEEVIRWSPIFAVIAENMVERPSNQASGLNRKLAL
jgi:hypothetical protein